MNLKTNIASISVLGMVAITGGITWAATRSSVFNNQNHLTSNNVITSNGDKKSYEPGSGLVIDYVNQHAGQWTIKVSGLKVQSGAFVGFRVLSAKAYSKFSPTNDDVGALFKKLSPVTSSTQVFTFNVSKPEGVQYVDAFEALGEGDTHELVDESTPVSLESLPYGQLPEVPWATGLPLMGAVGALLAVRMRSKHSSDKRI